MAKTSAPPKKKPTTPRKLQGPKYQSFKLQKRIKGEQLPGVFRLSREALGSLVGHWKIFLGIVIIYGLLNVLLVQGFHAAANLGDAKSTLDSALGGQLSQLVAGTALFFYLVGSSGNTVSPAAGAYQLVLVLVVSLALIWMLRQVYAGHSIRLRDGFYKGMTPLIPFVLVLLVLVLQLLPMGVGAALFGTVAANGLAVGAVEQLLWAVLFVVLAGISLFMLCSSLFALYIVTLPNMAPLRALRSAKELVAHRRWAVMRKVLFLPLALFAVLGVILIPLILFATPVVPWVFFALTMAMPALTHSYLYALYRAML